MTEAKEAQALAGIGTTVEFGGERLDVRPLLFGQLLDILAIADSLAESVAAADDLDTSDISFFFSLFSRHRKEVPQVLAIAVGRDVAFIEGGALDEAVKLFAAVYEVNRNFFGQNLAPVVQTLVAQWRGQAGNGGGRTPPSS